MHDGSQAGEKGMELRHGSVRLQIGILAGIIRVNSVGNGRYLKTDAMIYFEKMCVFPLVLFQGCEAFQKNGSPLGKKHVRLEPRSVQG